MSALDAGNQVAFYRGGTEVFSFDSADLLELAGLMARRRRAA